MIESGWTEPLLVVGAALFVHFALQHPRGVRQATAFLLLPALKQYVVAPVLMYLVYARQVPVRPRAIVAGLSISAATVLPFLIWNWRATLSGIVFQMSAPTVPRFESTSLLALIAMASGSLSGTVVQRGRAADRRGDRVVAAEKPRAERVAARVRVIAICHLSRRVAGLRELLLFHWRAADPGGARPRCARPRPI